MIENARSEGLERSFSYPRDHQLVFATDLDGTFLAGSDSARRDLYRFIRQHRSRIFLIFITGRGIKSAYSVLQDPLIPTADLLIADVGASIIDVASGLAVENIQAEIDAHWLGDAVVIEHLARFPGLRRQHVPQKSRVSYYAAPDSITDELRQTVTEELGCDLVYSSGCYLDILPAGTSKGTTLTAFLTDAEIPTTNVVVAGDSLNDYSLFITGYRGIVVGNAETQLIEDIQSHLALNSQLEKSSTDTTFFAQGAGTEGILQGLSHFGFVELLEKTSLVISVPDSASNGQRYDSIVVCHRLPFTSLEEDNESDTALQNHPNGLVSTLLRHTQSQSAVLWVGATSQAVEQGKLQSVSHPEYHHLTLLPISRTESELEQFHTRFCKQALWPILFSFPERAQFEVADWQQYVATNKHFAEEIARVAPRFSHVWLHDSPVWMVPYFLRELRRDLCISFFHHTAFPAADIFAILPWSATILTSLLQCEYLGFQIPRYVSNFVESVQALNNIEVEKTVPEESHFQQCGSALCSQDSAFVLHTSRGRIGLGAHPVGIDIPEIAEILERPKARQLIRELDSRLAGRTCLLSIDRLDYVKGPIPQLLAFERLLENSPPLHERIQLLKICAPPPKGQAGNGLLQHDIFQLVERINQRFAVTGWQPIDYRYTTLNFEDLLAHLVVAQIAWIAPLRDGLNLIAKEFIAAQKLSGRSGTLVLSEFAGASVELREAILCNPYDIEGTARVVAAALELSEPQRRENLERLSEIVFRYDIDYWHNDYLASVSKLRGKFSTS